MQSTKFAFLQIVITGAARAETSRSSVGVASATAERLLMMATSLEKCIFVGGGWCCGCGCGCVGN